MTTTKKIDKHYRKVIRKELTLLDILEAVRDEQKVFDKFLITSKIPSTNTGHEK